MSNRPSSAALWLRVSTDNRGQDPALQRADLDRLCEQRGWTVAKVYEVEESAFGKRPRLQFDAMLTAARRGQFDVLVVWSMDRFSREPVLAVMRQIIALNDCGVHFYSYSEPFLDTTGLLGPALIGLFAWLSHQDSLKKGERVRLGMAKARLSGKHIGRPVVRDKVDRPLVLRLRAEGKSWSEVHAAHPRVGRRKPSMNSIRRAAAMVP